MPKADVFQLGWCAKPHQTTPDMFFQMSKLASNTLRYSYALREVIMNFIQDKRFWYSIVAVIVVVMVVAAVFWPRNQTTESLAPATTSSPAATPAAPSTTAPKQ
jgi:hypothetical protein